MKIQSAIYSGTVWHRRFGSDNSSDQRVDENSGMSVNKPHGFQYQVFMMYLDLAELDSVFAQSRFWSIKLPALARFKRSDFLAAVKSPDDSNGVASKQQSLDETVRDHIEQARGSRPSGPIFLLANIRYWGFIINPISCYYCFDSSGQKLETILLDVTNTPWKESTQYILSCDSSVAEQSIRFDKAMHVSPFMPMEMQYQWAGSAPDEQLKFSLANFKNDIKVFDAGVNFNRQEITSAALNKVLWRFPFMTLKVFAGIHWQALKLLIKGVTIFPHPNKKIKSS